MTTITQLKFALRAASQTAARVFWEFYPGLRVWSIWGLECGCVDDAGRFADTYENQVIGCD